MDKHISLSPCPFCGMGLTLDIDEEGGVAILHSLKGEKNCWFPSIVEIEMPVETTLEEMVEILNRRPIQESFEHALVGASLVAAARLQDKYVEIQDLNAELAALKSENVNLSKKVTDYERELRYLTAPVNNLQNSYGDFFDKAVIALGFSSATLPTKEAEEKLLKRISDLFWLVHNLSDALDCVYGKLPAHWRELPFSYHELKRKVKEVMKNG